MFIPKLLCSGDVALLAWAKMTSFNMVPHSTNDGLVKGCASHGKVQLVTSIPTHSHSGFSHILPNTSVHMHTSFSVSAPWPFLLQFLIF